MTTCAENAANGSKTTKKVPTMIREPLYGPVEPDWCEKHDCAYNGTHCPECEREDEWEREEREWEEWHDQE